MSPKSTEPPFSPAIVEELLRQLDKTVRAHQLYMHNNPTYLKSVEALRAAFAPVWAETDSLSLSVADLKFVWCRRRGSRTERTRVRFAAVDVL